MDRTTAGPRGDGGSGRCRRATGRFAHAHRRGRSAASGAGLLGLDGATKTTT